MKKILSVCLSVILFFSTARFVFASTNPTDVPNNKFGIHIFSEKDLENAERLVNSNGGDWGYVTFVITEKERDHGRWQNVFDQMRRLHLIPIVRIATQANGDNWELPKESEINNWVAFLNGLNWVTQNRYVIIGNEPNHATEWGGTLDPAGYADYLQEFSQKLKNASDDFYVLPAALDASAKNVKGTMDEQRFIKSMFSEVPNLSDYIDGWNSHSYPNPDYKGAETDQGKGSIETYDWELTYLKSLGVTKKLPVFVTETGWSNKLGEDEVARRMSYAFKYIWLNDSRVVAVTPFILDYPQEPFADLSWQKSDGSFYKYYSVIQNLPKTEGKPKQIESGQIFAAVAQPVIPYGANFAGIVWAKNTGQSIWTEGINSLKSDGNKVNLQSYSFNNIEPTKLGLIVFKAASPDATGVYSQSLYVTGSKGQRITNSFAIEAYVFKLEQVTQFIGSLLGGKK